MPGLVQLTADNMNPSIDCSVVPLHIPFETVELKRSGDVPLRDSVSDSQFIHVISLLLTIHRSNGFAGSIAGAVLEAPTEELKIVSTEIPHSVSMMFVVSGETKKLSFNT